MPSIFGYWTLRGLGQASRFILEYTGEEYQDVRFDAVSSTRVPGCGVGTAGPARRLVLPG